MARRKKYNPEKCAWSGCSYKKAKRGVRFRIRDLREKSAEKARKREDE